MCIPFLGFWDPAVSKIKSVLKLTFWECGQRIARACSQLLFYMAGSGKFSEKTTLTDQKRQSQRDEFREQ